MAGVLGLLVGSFLNVVIHRLPKMLERHWREQSAEFPADTAAPASKASPAKASPAKASPAKASVAAPPYNLVTPRSACPACQAPISAWQNIPVVSYLALRGRCAHCGVRISLRYPLIELLCGLLTAAVAWKFGVGWPAVAAAVVTWFLIALAGIDLDHLQLPDDLTLPLLWGGLVASLFWTPAGTASLPASPAQAIVGAVAGYASLWAAFHLFRLCTGKEGMGYGDFKLLAALGAWLGGRMLLPIVLASATVGAIVGIALILSGQRGRGVPLPFGPFLAAAGWLAMMWGPEWVNAYVGLYGRV